MESHIFYLITFSLAHPDFLTGLFSPSCSLFHVPLSAAYDSDKVQEWLFKFPSFLLITFALLEEKS